MRKFAVVAVLFLTLSISLLCAEILGVPFGIFSFTLLFGGFILQGLRRIPAEPPYVGILTVFEQRKPIILREGWNFLPLYPWWFGFIPVKVEKIDFDLEPQKVRTPDLAELKVPVSLTLIPAYQVTEEDESGHRHSTERPDLLIEFLNSGSERGVKQILDQIVAERLREWAMSEDEGPKTWQQAMGASQETVTILLKSILGDELPPLPSSIPTPVLIKYFGRPQKYPSSDRDIERYGEHWEKLENNILPEDLTRHNITGEELERHVRNRIKLVEDARRGNGYFVKPQLGIVIARLNVGEITLLGELADIAEQEAKEEQQAKAEHLEMERVSDMIKVFTESGFSPEGALEIVQTERKKVTKNVQENKLSLSKEAGDVLKNIAPEILTALLGRSKKEDGHGS